MENLKKSDIKSILVVTHNFPPDVGGIETRISKYMQYLGKKGIRTTVVVLTSGRSKPLRYTSGYVKVFVWSGNLRYFFRNFLNLVRISARVKPNVVHVFTGVTTIIGLSSLLLGRTMNVPTVFSFFGQEGIIFRSLGEEMRFTIAATISTGIATNTSAMRSFVPPIFRQKTHLLMGGADPTSYTEQICNDSGGKTILYVGRLVKSKGVYDLLDAFSIVSQSIPEAKLIFVGDGPEKANLRKRAEELAISQSVELTGRLYGGELNAEYEKCNVFVLPSKYVKEDPAVEGLGLVLIEASMHGKPLIGSRIGGIPEIIRDGENGILVQESNPKELSKAIATLLSDRDLNTKMGRNSIEIAKREFTWDAATEKLLDCYVKSSSSKRYV